jgi:glycosyltransferase involved in cell wall biosynthesis
MGLSEGLNIEVANTPKEIAEAVVRIFKSEELWISLSEQGQDWVLKNYSQSVVKSRLLEVFNEIEKATT